MKIILFTLCILFYTNLCPAQNNFQRVVGGISDDDAKHVCTSMDQAFILAGSTLSFGNGATDGYLLKVDTNGSVVWASTYGNSDDDYLEWVEPTHDGGFILCGYTFSVLKQAFHAIIIRVDGTGNILWQKQIALADVTRAYCIRETFDHGFILCGEEDSSGADGNILLVKLDSLGNLQWNKSFGIPLNADVGQCVIQTNDSGFALCAYSRFGLNSSLAVVLKTDPQGILEWSKNYYSGSTSNRTYPNHIIQMDDDNYVISGSTYMVGQPQNNLFLFSLDTAGLERWSHVYSTGNWDLCNSMFELPELDGFLLCGYTSSPATGIGNALILKTDINGNLLWNESYGNDTLDSYFNSLSIQGMNNIFLVGTTYTFGAGGQEVFFAARDTTGLSNGCNTTQALFTSYAFPLTNNQATANRALSLTVDTLNYLTASGFLEADPCLNTSIEQASMMSKIGIYPNPGKGEFTISNPGSERVIQLTVTDELGRIIMLMPINSEEQNIRCNLSALAKGVYCIVVSTAIEVRLIKYIQV
ncbi:MAG: T9SS type A sorting domain-containing protein [Bacteroidetes bacterium]|nr:MAG: T9SS type A sorting domain-containing protein [Bacteroidota bacterium]